MRRGRDARSRCPDRAMCAGPVPNRARTEPGRAGPAPPLPQRPEPPLPLRELRAEQGLGSCHPRVLREDGAQRLDGSKC